MWGVSIIPTRFPSFAVISSTRWLFERSRIWRLLRLEIQSGIEPLRELFHKISTRRVEIWQIDFGNSPMMLLSWVSRCTRPFILVRILDKLPKKLFLPNATNVVNRVKAPIGSSLERVHLKKDQWWWAIESSNLVKYQKIYCWISLALCTSNNRWI